ncbi:cerebellin-4-like [Penaeus japonicus]|uniref:cerebellin-4-like n=1 Tax=Penaeus japonicus TaxID=27405 RepID=UPI001C70B0E5|nr:cerebellin-4-like [Penaeus japonicus]
MARIVALTLLLSLCGLAFGQGDRAAQSGGFQIAQAAHAAPPGNRCSSGFSVRKATSATSTVRNSGTTRLRFQDVLTGEGGWSPSESDFLAPCRGLYYFSFHGVAQDRGDFTLALVKNGQYQVTAYGGKGNYLQGSNSALLLLDQGDLVHLELQQGSLYEHPSNEAYTSFTGFLVEAF